MGKKDEPEERIMDEYIKKSAGKIHKDAPQPGKSSDIKRNCILIALVIVGFAFIVILYKSQVSA